MAETKRIKIVVVGSGSVGKTCLIQTFIDDKYPEETGTTGMSTGMSVYDNASKTIPVGDIQVAVELWDT